MCRSTDKGFVSAVLLHGIQQTFKSLFIPIRHKGPNEFKRLYQFYRDSMIRASVSKPIWRVSRTRSSNLRSTRTGITRSQTIGHWRVTLDLHSMNKSNNNWVNRLHRLASRCFHAQSRTSNLEGWNVTSRERGLCPRVVITSPAELFCKK